ncbi:hypothetical protein AK830_g3059 [Neonectria ditissima]|uniref:SAM-dependent MTase RsmB/NOP-type domain-containing protein n=1 Tax=Neonectria ditissima TaxID=78410 RepID=A0A0N8H841_9HYPO|nr:hypothetical protein AK830_g3059 [Neonectria ditissima]
MSLYHEAAEFLVGSASEGGSLKSRVFKKKNLKSPPNQVYALVLESCKWSPVIKEVIEKSELLKHERKLTPELSLLLVHDLLLVKKGIALPQTHGLRASVERHKGRLASEFTRARLRRKAASLDVLKEQIEKDSAGEEANYPRWVRVNAVKTSLEDQLETTFSAFSRAKSVQDVITKLGKHLFIDSHIPNLIAVTSGTDLTKTEAYTSGKIILQDKASCFPAYLLDPRSEDGDLIDACAAPGNKTTHLAAILKEHRPEFETSPQIIYAFEKDSRRAKTLDKMVTTAGSKSDTRIGFGQDFLQVDPQAERYKSVGALLLDPSCSGSGIVGRDSMPDLHLPKISSTTEKGTTGKGNKRKRKHGEVEAEEPCNVIVDDDGNETIMKSEKDLEARLEALSGFQLTLLLHAFRFPSARKITYSTCSVHMQENERVVMRALQSDIAKERNWGIMLRKDQVTGMREWPVRGLTSACGGNEDVADACIRSYKDDGQGVMGFFVAGFVRLDNQDAGSGDDEGPYLRDDDGAIFRDVLGMPVLKSTEAPVALNTREETGPPNARNGEVEEEEEEEDDDSSSSNSSDSDSDGDSGSDSAAEVAKDARNQRGVGVSAMNENEDEWQGLED